jgi:small subunit ribosomal protein S15
MSLSKENKQETITKFQINPNDKGSVPVQVALITERIKYISTHLQSNPKDFAGEHGLLKLVGQRKRLLNYLKSNDAEAYKKLIKELDLRK